MMVQGWGSSDEGPKDEGSKEEARDEGPKDEGPSDEGFRDEEPGRLGPIVQLCAILCWRSMVICGWL